MTYELDEETVQIIKALCDVGLKNGGLQMYQPVTKVLAAFRAKSTAGSPAEEGKKGGPGSKRLSAVPDPEKDKTKK